MAQAVDPLGPTQHRKLTFAHFGGKRQLTPMELIHRAASQAHAQGHQSVLDQLRESAAHQLVGHNKAPNAFDQVHNRHANGIQPQPGLGGDINRPPGQPQLHVPISEGGGFGNFPASGSSGAPVSPPIPNPGIHGFGPGGGVMPPGAGGAPGVGGAPGPGRESNPLMSNFFQDLQRRQELQNFGQNFLQNHQAPISNGLVPLGQGLFVHPITGEIHGFGPGGVQTPRPGTGGPGGGMTGYLPPTLGR